MNIKTITLAAALCLALAGSRSHADSFNPNTGWFKDARFGVFMHFLPGDDQGLDAVGKFDTAALAGQLETIGARYFVLTLGQNSGYFNAPNATYEAVFDFGIIHHVRKWQDVLAEVHRVLKPGGKLFAEEPVGGVLNHPLMHSLFAHPVEDRFDASDFRYALNVAGFIALKEEHLWHTMFWFVATKPVTDQQRVTPNDDPTTQLINS